MATRLSRMAFDEVSFVPRGAHQLADVVLFKRDLSQEERDGLTKEDDEMMGKCPDCGKRHKGKACGMAKKDDEKDKAKKDPAPKPFTGEGDPEKDKPKPVASPSTKPEGEVEAAAEKEGQQPEADEGEGKAPEGGGQEGAPALESPEEHRHSVPSNAKFCPDCGEQMGASRPVVAKSQPSGGDAHVPVPMGEDDEDDDENMPDGDTYVRPPDNSVPSSKGKPDKGKVKKGTPMLRSELPEAIAKHLPEDIAPEDEVTGEAFTAAYEASVAEAPVEKGDTDGLPEAIAKADPAVQALFKAQQEKVDEASSIAKAERDARLTREFTEVAKGYGNLPIDADEFGPVLKRLADLDTEVYAEVSKALKAANEAAGVLFKSTGSEPKGTVEGSSVTAIEKAVAEIRKSQPDLTEAEAWDKAMQDDPSLYEAAINS